MIIWDRPPGLSPTLPITWLGTLSLSLTHTCFHTDRQFSDSNVPKLHIFGLWGKTRGNSIRQGRENMQTPQRNAEMPPGSAETQTSDLYPLSHAHIQFCSFMYRKSGRLLAFWLICMNLFIKPTILFIQAYVSTHSVVLVV